MMETASGVGGELGLLHLFYVLFGAGYQGLQNGTQGKEAWQTADARTYSK